MADDDEQRRQKALLYREKNRERINARRRAEYKLNPAPARARAAARRAKQRQALTNGADLKAIEAIYDHARRTADIVGTAYHVDHIDPLARGGPHHETNLCVMRADYNLMKGDKPWPGLREWLYPSADRAREPVEDHGAPEGPKTPTEGDDSVS